MKLILEQEKMFKMTVSQDGQLSVALANGKQYAGPLAAGEAEQLLHRVTVISDGAIKFDPAPNDYIGMHETDVATLEAQSIAINELRESAERNRIAFEEVIAARDKTIEGQKEALGRLADCENELSKARTELKDALLVIEQQAAKLNIVKAEPKQDDIATVPEPQPAATAEAETPP